MVTVGLVFSQSLYDDLTNNNLEDFEAKAALLDVKINDFPFISYYIINAKRLQPETLAYLIKKGANVNQMDKDYLPPLFYAIIRNSTVFVQELIKAKADVNMLVEYDGKYRDSKNRFMYDNFWEVDAIKRIKQNNSTPLDFAFSYASPAIVKQLLNAKADPLLVLHQEVDSSKSTANKPVYINYTIVDAMFSYLSACLRDNSTPLWQLYSKAYIIWQAVLKLPQAKRPEMPYADNLYATLIAGNTDMFKQLLATMSGDTIQYIPFALLANQWNIVELLYKLNNLTIEDPIKLGTYNEQPLLAWAITAGFPAEAIVLINKGAKIPETIFYKTGDKYPVLTEATYVGDLELVKTLLAKGVSVANSDTLFYCHSKPDIRKLLIKAGMDPFKKFTYLDYTFYSILTDAALFGYEEAVAYYISIKLPVNVRDPAEVPPLFAAVASANYKVVDILIKAGADINQYIDCYGFEDFLFVYLDGSYTPLALAYFLRDKTDDPYKKAQYTKIVKLLESLNADNKTSVE